MKLLLIVLVLLVERYLIHRISLRRFYWFSPYVTLIKQRLPTEGFFSYPLVLLGITVVPLVAVTALVYFLITAVMLWTLGFFMAFISACLLQGIILYYCLGPENPFYPLQETPLVSEGGVLAESTAVSYFSSINGQLFAVIFWYLVLGPLGALLYRLCSLSQKEEKMDALARTLVGYLDWIPARLTALFYLLVGNFQRGFHFFLSQLLVAPSHNATLLSEVGMLVSRSGHADETVSLPQAQHLVEQALIAELVLIAFVTLAMSL